LYIARELVKAHGGTIGVTSSPEAGTVFTVHLPKHLRENVPATHPGAALTPT
jgi:signal transduction histidine kinase